MNPDTLPAAFEPVPNTNRRFVLKEKLGQGGMGVVYHAWDRLIGRDVAFKRVLPITRQKQIGSSTAIDFNLGFAQEFQILASLRHPNIISVLDYGFDVQRTPYYTMELLHEPKTIAKAGANQPLEKQLDLIVQLLRALVYLHQRQLLHRDLKPSNILVEDGIVKLVDFGLSINQGQANDQNSGNVGTVPYMAPELILEGSPSIASDLYSAGVVAYELFAGQRPFRQDNHFALVYSIVENMPDMSIVPVSAQLKLIISKLLAKSPQDRFASAADVIQELPHLAGQALLLETIDTRESFLQASRFIGRQEEMVQLTGALNEVIGGKRSIWLIGGESGVGKSRLVDELRSIALVRGVNVLRGQLSSESTLPYELWQEPLRSLALMTDLTDFEAGVLKLLIPDLATLLDREIQDVSALEPEAAQDRLFGVIEGIFARQTHPTLLILEDIHWAVESFDLLVRLVHNVQSTPLFIIGTYRNDERPDVPQRLPTANTLNLPRLSIQHIAELSESMLGNVGKQPEVLDFLIRETEGNVYFLIEVVRALAEEAGALKQIGNQTLPQQVFTGGINQILQRRLNRVPGRNRPLLNLAALAGRQLDLNLLKITAPETNLDQWLIECAAAAVLDVQHGRWQFAHDKLRDAIAKTLDATQRMTLYRQVADNFRALHQDDLTSVVPQLAYYYQRSDDHRSAYEYSRMWGEQLFNIGRFADSLDTFQRARTYLSPDKLVELGLIFAWLGRAAFYLKRYPPAYAISPMSSGQDDGNLDYSDAEQYFHQSLEFYQAANDLAGQAAVYEQLGRIAIKQFAWEAAIQQLETSREYYELLALSRDLARVINELANCYMQSGDETRAVGLYREALTISRKKRR